MHAADGWDELPTEERARLLARQGQGYTIADLVRVVDDEMRDVPRDAATLGEVIMRGNNVMAGYFGNDETTAQAFRGGWFHSGDLAVWHPDGSIELRDRAKDMIISGGENISSSRSSRRSARTRPCSSAPSSRSRTTTGASARRRSSRSTRGGGERARS